MRPAGRHADAGAARGRGGTVDATDIGGRLDGLAISRFHWRVLALISAALLVQIIVLLTMGIETKQRSLEDLAVVPA